MSFDDIKQEIERLAKDINSFNSLVNKEKKTYDDELSTIDDDIKELENEKECLEDGSCFRKAFSVIQTSVNTILQEQSNVSLASELTLSHWMQEFKNPTYSESQYLQEFEQNILDFTTAIKSYLSVSNNFLDQKYVKDLKTMAKSYTILNAIMSKVGYLAETYSIKKIVSKEKELQTARSNKKKELSNNENRWKADFEEKFKKLNEFKKKYVNEHEIMEITNYTNSDDTSLPYILISGYIRTSGKVLAQSNLLNKKEVVDFSEMLISCYVGDDDEGGGPANFIVHETGHNEKIDEYVNNLFLSFLSTYPATNAKIIMMADEMGSRFNELSRIYDYCSFQYSPDKKPSYVVTEREKRAIIDKLYQYKNDDVGRSLQAKSVYIHNHDIWSGEKTGLTKDVILMVIRDFPKGFENQETIEKIRKIYEEGPKYGIITVIFYDPAFDFSDTVAGKEAKAFLNEAEKTSTVREYDSDDGIFIEEGEFILEPLVRSDDFSIDIFADNLIEEIKSAKEKPIMIDSIWENNEKNKNANKILSIPIGKDENGVTVNLDLNVDDNPHVIINGISGSGKTAFLRSLILSAAYKYSPEEIEIEAIDFKNGAGFRPFQDLKLPHISFISLENRKIDAIDVLRHIEKKMIERNKKKSRGEEVGARLLIVIDEINVMLDEEPGQNSGSSETAMSILKRIAKQGREVGISLVLSGQSVPSASSFKEILQELAHRFAFYGGKRADGTVTQLISYAREDDLEKLGSQKGLCLYEAPGKKHVMMRAAFSGDVAKLGSEDKPNTFNHYIKEVAKKYRNYKSNLRIVGKGQPLIITKAQKDADGDVIIPSIFYDHDGSQLDLGAEYAEKRALDFYLGKNYISYDDIVVKMNSSNPTLFVLGDYIKSKHIVLSIINGALNELRQAKGNNGDGLKIIVADAWDDWAGYVDQPLDYLKEKVAYLSDHRTAFSQIAFYEGNDIEASFTSDDGIYGVYEQRKMEKERNNRQTFDPIVIVLLGLDFWHGSNELSRNVIEMMKEGRTLGIYFVLQFDKIGNGNQFYTDLRRSRIMRNNVILLSDKNEPNEIKDNFDCIVDEFGQGSEQRLNSKLIADEGIPDEQSLLYDGKTLSKFCYYQFTNEWIDSYIDHILRIK